MIDSQENDNQSAGSFFSRLPFLRMRIRTALILMALIGISISMYRAHVLNRLRYDIQGIVQVDWVGWGLFNLKRSEEWRLVKRLNIPTPPANSATISGVINDSGGVGVSLARLGLLDFSIEGTYWNYPKKTELLKRSIDDFVRRNSDLPIGKTRVEIHTHGTRWGRKKVAIEVYTPRAK